MFNRNNPGRSLPDRITRAEVPDIDIVSTPPQPRPLVSTYDMGMQSSVIGRDLTIMGEKITILSKGALEIDAEIVGNLGGVELVIGEHARVNGTVAAETVVVRGEVIGAVRGHQVTLQSGARVSGDITYSSLSVEQGAVFDGRSRYSRDENELRLSLEAPPEKAPPATNGTNGPKRT